MGPRALPTQHGYILTNDHISTPTSSQAPFRASGKDSSAEEALFPSPESSSRKKAEKARPQRMAGVARKLRDPEEWRRAGEMRLGILGLS